MGGLAWEEEVSEGRAGQGRAGTSVLLCYHVVSGCGVGLGGGHLSAVMLSSGGDLLCYLLAIHEMVGLGDG